MKVQLISNLSEKVVKCIRLGCDLYKVNCGINYAITHLSYY